MSAPTEAEPRSTAVELHGAWDEVLELDPEMFEAYTGFPSVSWQHGSLEPKAEESVYTAFDCVSTHLYVKGWKAHMNNALGYGATVGELREVMEIAAVMGRQSALQALPVLREELLTRPAVQPAVHPLQQT